MTVSAYTDTTAAPTAGVSLAPGPPLFLISAAVFVVCLFVAIGIMASYRLYGGESLRDLLSRGKKGGVGKWTPRSK